MKNLTILKRSQPPRDSFLSRRGTSILLVCALLAVGACSQPSRTGTGADPTPSSPPVETTDGSDGIEVGLVEGTEEWALTSLDELRRESELIVEGTVDGTRLTGGHQSQADPNQRIEQRLLTLTVIDVLRGDVGEGAAIEIYDANLYTEDDRARYLLVYLDAEVRVGDRVIVALVPEESIEGAHTINSSSAFFLLDADGTEIRRIPRRNPAAAEAQALSVDELRAQLSG